jgi:hypothetical protein
MGDQRQGSMGRPAGIGHCLAVPLAVFGGNSRNHERLSQALAQSFAGVVANTINYQATTRLRWTDYGGRAGLDVRFPVFAGWTIDVGGWIGVAEAGWQRRFDDLDCPRQQGDQRFGQR